jgi:class 3 adenylate cyclase
VDVSLWLHELGLARDAPAFAANDIDGELLVSLGDADLRELGVASLGHRRRLLKAIAALRGELSDEGAPAERRQLTLMFVDLVGSTELAQALDPEDLRLVMRSYQMQCTAVIKRLGGHVAKYLGDGVLAYFGWPAALEDGAERAVDAGIEVCDAVARLAPAAERALAARVGIATGLVVVGDLVGSGAAREAAVVGETPNLAARLQQLAEPGRVVITESTRRLLGAGYALEDLGPQRLHGFAAPIRVWQVGGGQYARVRFATRLAQGLTPLLGRDAELALLLEQWRLACRGQGRAVVLSGEAGIGKSRLAEALRQRLAGEPCTLLHYQCSPRHGGTTLHPVIEQLKEAAGGATDAGAEAAARARRLLAELIPESLVRTAPGSPITSMVAGPRPWSSRHPWPTGSRPFSRSSPAFARLIVW